jgi:hypothetical protein
MADALLKLLMRILCLLLLTGLSSMMARGAEKDPFAIYHQAIDERLAAMAAASSEVAKEAPDVSEPLEPKTCPVVNATDFARRFWGGRDAGAALSRLEYYRPTLEGILERERVPKSLVAVVLVESGAQPLALSLKRARGLWQLIPTTAREYGLTVTSNKDERVQVEQSTHAAARYLSDLYQKFGDWPLALAGYNAGPEAVQRALQRGHATTFSQISAARLLPEETRNYVSAVLSAIELLGADSIVEPQPSTKERRSRILYASAAVTN